MGGDWTECPSVTFKAEQSHVLPAVRPDISSSSLPHRFPCRAAAHHSVAVPAGTTEAKTCSLQSNMFSHPVLIKLPHHPRRPAPPLTTATSCNFFLIVVCIHILLWSQLQEAVFVSFCFLEIQTTDD